MARLRPTHWLALVLGLTFVLYAPSLGNTYAFDDRFAALAVRDDGRANRMVNSLQPLWTYFTTHYWDGVYPGDVLFRPITTLSVAILHAWFGRHGAGEWGQALPQHLANVLLHVVATWLAYRLARRAGLGRSGSVVTALLFGVHAIHSEVVAGVVGRSELLAFVFGAGAVVVATGRPTAVRLGGAAVLAFLAFGSKESGLAWTGLLGLFVALRARRTGQPWLRPALLRSALVAGPGAALFLLLRARMIASLPFVADTGTVDGLTLRLTGTVGWGWGLLMSLVPAHLACDHGPAVFPPVTSPVDARFLLAAGALTAVGVAAVATWRRAPVVAAGLGTFLLGSVLTSNVLFGIGVPFAERLYYTPSFGLCLAASAVLARAPARVRPLVWAVAALWLAWSGFMVLQRNPVWANDAALFAHEYDNQPRSARIALNWAGVLRKAGREAELEPVLRRVVELDPEMAAAWNELAVLAMRAGQTEVAIAHLQACLRARRQDGDVHRVALENLVRIYATQRQPSLALQTIESVAAREPATVARAFTALQDLLAQQVDVDGIVALAGRLQQAAPAARRDWDRQRGLACYRRQAWSEAVRYLEQALHQEASPLEHQQTSLLLASALLQAGDRQRARDTVQGLLASPGLVPELAASARDLLQKVDGGR
ncbi:MAG: hypothetical protein R3F56_14250 [Planctomycetota bacterium]